MRYAVIFNTRLVLSLIATLFAMFLIGCSNDSGNTARPVTEKSSSINRMLSGTVAVGAPVAGIITIVDANGGISTADSDDTGEYSTNLEGRLGPYLLRVQPEDTTLPVMYSYASGPGVANITSFTTLALYLAHPADLASALTAWSALHTNWTRSGLEQAVATINANFDTALLNSGVSTKTYDFFTAPFTADHTGIDQFLYDNYKVSVDFANNTYAITDSSSQPVAFDPNADTTGYYIGAQFMPPANASWTYTAITNIDGTAGTPLTLSGYTSDVIPWNEQRFMEFLWTNLALQSKQITNCDTSGSTDCQITVEVTEFSSSYNITGNGEVGTLISASTNYGVSVQGYVGSGQARQDIDETHSWSFAWSWERTL